MSLTLIEINGELYHAQDLYNEDGEMIPASVCLCYAFEPGECSCATTAWENYRYDDYDMEDGDDTA